MNSLASILVVEPDPVLREELTRRLLRNEMTVTAVFHPRQALEAASFCEFDAAVIAEILPESSGVELATQLRRLIANLEVLLLTDTLAPDLGPMGIKRVANSVVIEEVEASLDRMLAKRSWGLRGGASKPTATASLIS